VGALWHSANPGSAIFLEAMHNVTYSKGISLETEDVRRAENIQPTISALAPRIDGLVVFAEAFMWTYRREIVEAVKAARVPTRAKPGLRWISTLHTSPWASGPGEYDEQSER
jgi:putative tryptophan/tyrosine transport system substrate-binding protein